MSTMGTHTSLIGSVQVILLSICRIVCFPYPYLAQLPQQHICFVTVLASSFQLPSCQNTSSASVSSSGWQTFKPHSSVTLNFHWYNEQLHSGQVPNNKMYVAMPQFYSLWHLRPNPLLHRSLKLHPDGILTSDLKATKTLSFVQPLTVAVSAAWIEFKTFDECYSYFKLTRMTVPTQSVPRGILQLYPKRLFCIKVDCSCQSKKKHFYI